MDLSVVIPVRNEARGLQARAGETVETLEPRGARFEVVFVDDHSTDDTAVVVERLSRQDSRVRLCTLHGERGKDAALICGMRRSRGEILITMDGDGQNDPRDIPRLLDTLHECDMVCGIRRGRKAGLHRRASSWIANRVRDAVTGDSIGDAGCALRAMRRPCAEWLCRLDPRLFDAAHYFYPTLARGHGFVVRQIPVSDRPRRYGKSKFAAVRGRMISGLRACWRERGMVREGGVD